MRVKRSQDVIMDAPEGAWVDVEGFALTAALILVQGVALGDAKEAAIAPAQALVQVVVKDIGN